RERRSPGLPRVGQRLRSELHQPYAGRELRPLDELGDAFDSDGVTNAHGHAEDLLGELAHALEQYGASREDGAGRELLEQAGVLDALAHQGEDFLDARLDDVGEHAARGLARRVAADPRNLDL